ncbi:hypothetical protein E4T48_06647 [Aureobasidium sp. EXF-10727]|nr:hypothetical protein E4T48_06647 [Aureobasidium sp. EXF-10727]
MASTAPLKRKRSGEDVVSTAPKRTLRPRSASEMTTIVIQPGSISKTRVKRRTTKRSVPVVPTTTTPSSNLLLQKDQIIEQLRLELAEAHNELAKTQRRLEEVEKRLPEPAAAV